MAESAAQLRELVRHRAANRCEYCRIWAGADLAPFHLEHIVPRQHGGVATLENLALACGRCNAFKGPNLTAIDSASGLVVVLFNPRLDGWDEHFAIEPDGGVSGRTPVGRATVVLLNMNDDFRRVLRLASGL